MKEFILDGSTRTNSDDVYDAFFLALLEAALSLDPAQRSAFSTAPAGIIVRSGKRSKSCSTRTQRPAAFSGIRCSTLPTADNGHGSQAPTGPYTLLELIGQGGMGEVWLAERKHPVRRRVAIKLIKLGMDTREVMARFESERQALALLDHPAIAKVFDAGSPRMIG